MRNSPTPSTEAAAAAVAEAPSETLARILTRVPSLVAPGPDQVLAARASRTRTAATPASGATIT